VSSLLQNFHSLTNELLVSLLFFFKINKSVMRSAFLFYLLEDFEFVVRLFIFFLFELLFNQLESRN